MGRPPTHGAPSFRFHAPEVGEMERIIREHGGNVPSRDLLVSLASKFSNSPERAGKSIVQMKQVWNWFQNRRYALRSKLVKPPPPPPGFSHIQPSLQVEGAPVMNVHLVPQQPQPSIPSGHNLVRNTNENLPMEFEGKSARDGAWYDVQAFLSQRYFETGNPEVLVRFSGFGQAEDEWLNVRKNVRQRSLPCETSECIIVLPGDLILCFQEGKEQALYFDAHVLEAQRRQHDVRGCRCRFLVRFDHDQSEEIVALRKICRRPETDYRMQILHSTNDSASASSSVPTDSKRPAVDPATTSTSWASNPNPFPSHTIVDPMALASASASSPDPAPAPSLTRVSSPTPSLTPVPGLTPSTSVSVPDIHLNPVSAPSATQNLSLTPVSIQSSIPVGAPEVKKIESGSQAASLAGEASARGSITNPPDASMIMEVKLEVDISIPKTPEVAGGSSLSQGELSNNPSVTTVVFPQKVESIITPSEPIEVITAPMEGG